MLETTSKSCDWSKGLAKHRETRRWSDFINKFSNKHKIRSENRETQVRRSVSKQRKSLGGAVSQAKHNAERKRFGKCK